MTQERTLFLTKGYRGVSMKEIADAVEVRPSALYYHFPDGKEGLFTRMIQTLFEERVADTDQTLMAAPSLRERLTRLTSSLLTLPMNERFAMLLRDAREHIKNPKNKRTILSLRDRIKRQVTDLFQAAHEAGEIRADLPVPVLVSLYMGMLRMSESHPAAPLVAVLLDGIASPRKKRAHGGAH